MENMENFIKTMVEPLVDNKAAVTIESVEEEDSVTIKLHADENDLGKIIGKQGRTAKAIRTLVRAASARDGRKIYVEIL